MGASPYGLFAIMTGVGGRPVTLIEAANTMDGPWVAVPLRYQVNDPAASLPWCFPHFPRMDWSRWFVPLGDPGRWLAQLLRGLLSGDPAILSLVDERAFRAAFAEAIDSLDLGIPVLPADQAEARCTLLEAGDGDE